MCIDMRYNEYMILIPRLFYQDHCERGLPAPVDHGKSKRHALIDADDPALPELLSDARFYSCDTMVRGEGGYWETCRGLVLSARATVKAIEKAKL